MPTDCISYQNSGYFSPLMNDYLEQKSNYSPFITDFQILKISKHKFWKKKKILKIKIELF